MLYDSQVFIAAGIELRFLVSDDVSYPQRSPGYVPHLSIIDTLMELGRERTVELLARYSLQA